MSGEIVKAELLDWEGESVEVITEPDGSIWFTAEYIGRKLGYANPANDIWKILKAHIDEFTETDYKFIEIPSDSSEFSKTEKSPKTQRILVFSLDGANLILMFSRKPKAKPFRFWLKKAATEIKTKGYYIEGGGSFVTEEALDQKLERFTATITSAVIKALPAAIPQQTPAEMYQQAINVSRNNYMTPTECAYELFGGLPAGFNSGGHFDDYCAMRHMEEFGRYPERREPPLFKGNKIREWILPKDVKHKQYVKMWGKEYLKKHTSGQTSLKFKPQSRP